MGFGIRLMPGVRISASTRGIRAGIGPRAARIHVGSGRAGISSGVGPFTYYTSGGSRRRSGSRRAPSLAAYERQVRAAERQAELEHWLRLNQEMLSLAFVHRDTFPTRTTAPVAPSVEPVDEDKIRAQYQREQIAGIRFWKYSERREAKRRAAELANAAVEDALRQRSEQDAANQEELNEWWRRLLANDREVVFEAIEMAFEDNEMPAAPIDVSAEVATLLMRIGAPSELIPEREVLLTPSGKPSHKRRTKGSINLLYGEILASHAIATVKEALAVAPGVRTIRLLVIRGDRLGGGPQLIPLYVGQFERAAITDIDWDDINVLGFIERHGEIRYKGQAQEIAPLQTKTDPELRATVDELAAQLDWKPAP